VKISGTHCKCNENFRAMIFIRTANCILTYGVGSGEGACPSPVKKTLNKWASVNISGTNWKSIGNSHAMHFQCIPLNFMCPDLLYTQRIKQRCNNNVIINVLQTAQCCVYNILQSVYTHGRPCDVRLPFDYTHGSKIIKHPTLL